MDTRRWKFLYQITAIFTLALLMVPAVLSQTNQPQQEKPVDLKKEPWKEPLPDGLYIKPYLQNVTQHSIVVMWETKAPLIGHVDYGLNRSFGNRFSEAAPVTIHEIEIGNLNPGTTYHYRVRYGEVTLDASTFKTAPPEGVRNYRIIVYGDARSDPKTHRKNVEQMLKFNPDLILHTGDIVASGTTYELWQPQHFWPVQIISDKVPMFPTLGNHEQNSTHHFNYMSLPGNEVYYSFDYAGVHIVCLDSNAGWTPYQAGSPQYEWLIKDLEAHQDAEWTFVYFHHPIFRCQPTRGIEAQRYTWHPIFKKYGVDLVLSGHDHYYFRSYPIGKLGLEPRQGVHYLTTGGGGAPLYPISERIYGAASKSIHHTTVLDIQGSRIEGRAIDSDGNQFDYFTLTHTPTPGAEYIAYEVFEIERGLRDELDKIKPVIVAKSGEKVVINTTLSVPTDFEIRIEGEMVWDDSDKWKFVAQKTPFVINPGATLKIPIKGEATYPDVYPIPKLTLHFSKLIGRKEGFRNNTLTLYPMKIQPLLPVTVRHVYTPVAVDGKLDDPAWASATKLSDFVTEQGDARPTQKLTAMLAHDGKYLYAAAQIDGDPKLVGEVLFRIPLNPPLPPFEKGGGGDLDNENISDGLRQAFKNNGTLLSQNVAASVRKKDQWWLITDRDNRFSYSARKAGESLDISVEEGSTDRDNQNILNRDEHFAVYLSDGSNVYVFGANARGTQLDANKSDRGWNLDWVSRTVATETGWVAEMAIPIVAFGTALSEKSWRIGVSRGDKTNSEFVSLAPSFTMTSLENKLPEYGHSSSDVSSLSPLDFEGIVPSK